VNLKLHGRHALVTGATRGIGKSIACEFAKEGINLTLVSRDMVSMNELQRELEEQYSIKVSCFECDMRRRDRFDRLSQIAQASPNVDFLINNAGETMGGGFFSQDEDAWEIAVEVKLKGYLAAARVFSAGMIERRFGRIINIIGRTATLPEPSYLAGSAINAALVNITKNLAKILGEKNISVNAINPGAISTERWKKIVSERSKIRNIEESVLLKEAIDRIPLRKIGEVRDIAGLVVFLCSEYADYINGAVIAVDGGSTA